MGTPSSDKSAAFAGGGPDTARAARFVFGRGRAAALVAAESTWLALEGSASAVTLVVIADAELFVPDRFRLRGRDLELVVGDAGVGVSGGRGDAADLIRLGSGSREREAGRARFEPAGREGVPKAAGVVGAVVGVRGAAEMGGMDNDGKGVADVGVGKGAELGATAFDATKGEIVVEAETMGVFIPLDAGDGRALALLFFEGTRDLDDLAFDFGFGVGGSERCEERGV